MVDEGHGDPATAVIEGELRGRLATAGKKTGTGLEAETEQHAVEAPRYLGGRVIGEAVAQTLDQHALGRRRLDEHVAVDDRELAAADARRRGTPQPRRHGAGVAEARQHEEVVAGFGETADEGVDGEAAIVRRQVVRPRAAAAHARPPLAAALQAEPALAARLEEGVAAAPAAELRSVGERAAVHQGVAAGDFHGRADRTAAQEGGVLEHVGLAGAELPGGGLGPLAAAGVSRAPARPAHRGQQLAARGVEDRRRHAHPAGLGIVFRRHLPARQGVDDAGGGELEIAVDRQLHRRELRCDADLARVLQVLAERRLDAGEPGPVAEQRPQSAPQVELLGEVTAAASGIRRRQPRPPAVDRSQGVGTPVDDAVARRPFEPLAFPGRAQPVFDRQPAALAAGVGLGRPRALAGIAVESHRAEGKVRSRGRPVGLGRALRVAAQADRPPFRDGRKIEARDQLAALRDLHHVTPGGGPRHHRGEPSPVEGRRAPDLPGDAETDAPEMVRHGLRRPILHRPLAVGEGPVEGEGQRGGVLEVALFGERGVGGAHQRPGDVGEVAVARPPIVRQGRAGDPRRGPALAAARLLERPPPHLAAVQTQPSAVDQALEHVLAFEVGALPREVAGGVAHAHRVDLEALGRRGRGIGRLDVPEPPEPAPVAAEPRPILPPEHEGRAFLERELERHQAEPEHVAVDRSVALAEAQALHPTAADEGQARAAVVDLEAEAAVGGACYGPRRHGRDAVGAERVARVRTLAVGEAADPLPGADAQAGDRDAGDAAGADRQLDEGVLDPDAFGASAADPHPRPLSRGKRGGRVGGFRRFVAGVSFRELLQDEEGAAAFEVAVQVEPARRRGTALPAPAKEQQPQPRKAQDQDRHDEDRQAARDGERRHRNLSLRVLRAVLAAMGAATAAA